MKKIFVKAAISRIFFARLFDLIITSIFITINLIFIKVDSYLSAIEFIFITLFVYILFLLIIPILFKKRTIGKMILRIHLLDNESFKPVSFKVLLLRELYFIFIPYIIEMIFQFGRAFISVEYGEVYNDYGVFFQNIGQLIYVLWFVYICLTVIMQENKLSIVDLKNNCSVYIIESVVEEDKSIPDFINDVPGLIDKDELAKIKNIDYKDVVQKNEK